MNDRRLAVLVILAIGAGCSGPATQPPPSDPVPTVNVFASFDDFNDALAKRVTERITEKPLPDFLVVAVQGGAYPVGTLLRENQLIPVSAAACQPAADDKEILSTSAPTLFPSYSMTRKVAGSFGLDDAVFEGIASAGLSAAEDSTVNLSIADTTLDQWTDTGVTTVLSTDACRKALKSGYRLVRGVVKGRRQFAFGLNRTGKADAGIKSVGNFQLELSGGGSMMTVADPKAEEFVMVLSSVTLPASTATEITLAAPTNAPPLLTGSAHQVYIQADAAEGPAVGKRLVKQLSDLKIDVSPVVERIPTAKMPSSPQVRYFHAEDESKAQDVLASIKQEYPKAVLVPLRVPAPAGQLEVWLPHK